MADPVTMTRMALLLGDEQNRKRLGWAVAAILSPTIGVRARLCAVGSGPTTPNPPPAQLCLGVGPPPAEVPAEYRACIEQTRSSFTELDEILADVQSNMEDGNSLDPLRVKAVFFSLYFGGEAPPLTQFAHCFTSSETRTETVTEKDENGNDVEVERIYNVFAPITDMDTVYSRIAASLGAEITEEQKSNADNLYSLIKYGYPTAGDGGAFEGADVPYVGADGFCSPVGAGWRGIVTSEFGGRRDPITGKQDGHTGMDLAVPTGTPVRAVLPGTVRVAKYDSSYGYYVTIGHENGLLTLYGHNSRLLVRPGQVVQAGDVVSLSGSTGRSTGPHLHFEVRVNGQRTNPRYYLP